VPGSLSFAPFPAVLVKVLRILDAAIRASRSPEQARLGGFWIAIDPRILGPKMYRYWAGLPDKASGNTTRLAECVALFEGTPAPWW
jgi:hypothetical protein